MEAEMRPALIALVTSVRKETRIILRDREAFLLLFLMPFVFVLVMSLALQGSFREHSYGARAKLLVINHDDGAIGEKLAEQFRSARHFTTEVRTEQVAREELEAEVRLGHYKFAIIIPPKTTEQAVKRVAQQLDATVAQVTQQPIAIDLLADPAVQADQRALMMTTLNRALQEVETGILLKQVGEAGKRLVRARQLFPEIPAVRAPDALHTFAEVKDPPHDATTGLRPPTSVQQGAPSWIVLGMFLLVIPLSVTFIRERQLGTLQRLHSLGVSPWVVMVGKIIPYLVVNQIQFGLILLEGMYVLPWLGGDALTLGHTPGALIVVSLATSATAIGFAFLIAVMARTTEQAHVFAPASILILAAIGGVMVPKFVMPVIMQQIAAVSPLSWALEALLDVLVRAGGLREAAPEVGGLLLFAGCCFAVVIVRFRRYFRA